VTGQRETTRYAAPEMKIAGDACTCRPEDPGGVDWGCRTHGEHPCQNGFRPPHEPGVRGQGCCDHCIHIIEVQP
jgi:hypothetical protein